MIGKQKAARPRITFGSLVEIKFLYVGAGGPLIPAIREVSPRRRWGIGIQVREGGTVQ
jgi:hypothetical protein